jgi:peptide deformylase
MTKMDRRHWLVGVGGLAAAPLMASCAAGKAGQRFDWTVDERLRVDEQRPDFEVVTRGSPATRILRRRAREVPGSLDLENVAGRMEAAMRTAGGVGIAGPQVGLGLRIAVLELDYKTDHPRTVFVRNPLILERSDETMEGYEGCLSVPDVGGLVRRSRWIKVSYQLESGRTETAEAEGPNAVLWQHELDHLDGVLYVDRLLGELLPMEEVRRLREQADKKPPAEPPPSPDVSRSPAAEPFEGSLFLLA